MRQQTSQLLSGRVTALQMMFVSCRATCPIQGAIFSRVQKLISGQASQGIQLLSLTVDPVRDNPKAIASWLKTFHASAGWIAAAPEIESLGELRSFFGLGSNPADDHTTQVSIIDRRAQLIWRTSALPPAEEIAALLRAAAG